MQGLPQGPEPLPLVGRNFECTKESLRLVVLRNATMGAHVNAVFPMVLDVKMGKKSWISLGRGSKEGLKSTHRGILLDGSFGDHFCYTEVSCTSPIEA